MSKQGYGAYNKAQAQELDQSKLVLMMYCGAVNFLNKAVQVHKIDKVKLSENIFKTKNVLLELMSSLNFDEGGEMASLLLETYKELYLDLSKAQLNEDVEKLIEIRNSISELETSWRQVFSSPLYLEFKKNRECIGLQM